MKPVKKEVKREVHGDVGLLAQALVEAIPFLKVPDGCWLGLSLAFSRKKVNFSVAREQLAIITNIANRDLGDKDNPVRFFVYKDHVQFTISKKPRVWIYSNRIVVDFEGDENSAGRFDEEASRLIHAFSPVSQVHAVAS